MSTTTPLALVLGGGNALGAYQAGAYEALHRRGLQPNWLIGTSSGAINAALIAGNRPGHRLERLRAYWTVPEPSVASDDIFPPLVRRSLRDAGVLGTTMVGRPLSFLPRPPLPWSMDPTGASPSLYDTRPLAASLERFVDFDLLNDSDMRVSVNATDMLTGEEVIFTTGHDRISADHVRASSAFPPLYPSIRLDGRLLGDGGLAANLPIGIALAQPLAPAMLCLAVDVISPHALPPSSTADALQRRDDLLLASQTRHAVARWAEQYAKDDAPPVTLVHLIYASQDDEAAGKILDYSLAALASRWARGLADAGNVLDRLVTGEIPLAERGLLIHRVLARSSG